MNTLEAKSSGYAGMTAAFVKEKIRVEPDKEFIYPESDGKPMADNTEQYEWIVLIKENLETMFADSPDVFVAADLLWYPVERKTKISAAPDVMVAFGRPKGKRGSYVQCKEDNIPPQVVFEILSPSNTKKEMTEKLGFYDRHGVGEYYLYDPARLTFRAWIRSGKKVRPVENVQGWRSPALKTTFKLEKTGLRIYDPSGQEFTTLSAESKKKELERQRAEKAESEKELERQRAEKERQRAEKERQRAEKERQRAEKAESERELEKQRAERAESERELERQRADMLAEKLRSLGIREI